MRISAIVASIALVVSAYAVDVNNSNEYVKGQGSGVNQNQSTANTNGGNFNHKDGTDCQNPAEHQKNTHGNNHYNENSEHYKGKVHGVKEKKHIRHGEGNYSNHSKTGWHS